MDAQSYNLELNRLKRVKNSEEKYKRSQLYFARSRMRFSIGCFLPIGCVSEIVAASYTPISAPCYRQKSTRYKIRIRDHAKYITLEKIFESIKSFNFYADNSYFRNFSTKVVRRILSNLAA